MAKKKPVKKEKPVEHVPGHTTGNEAEDYKNHPKFDKFKKGEN